jgi:hypothetical protein
VDQLLEDMRMERCPSVSEAWL